MQILGRCLVGAWSVLGRYLVGSTPHIWISALHCLPISCIPVQVIRLCGIRTSSVRCRVPSFPKPFVCTGHLPIMDFVVSIHALTSFSLHPSWVEMFRSFQFLHGHHKWQCHWTTGFFVRPVCKTVHDPFSYCLIRNGQMFLPFQSVCCTG